MKRREFLLGASAVAIAAVLPSKREESGWIVAHRKSSPVTILHRSPPFDPDRGFVGDGSSTYISCINGFSDDTYAVTGLYNFRTRTRVTKHW